MTVVSVLGATIRLSVRYLPPMNEPPPFAGDARQGQNWVGQGGLAWAGYLLLLLGAAYCIKWLVLARCARRLAAINLFAMFIVLSLPYIWFLCEPDWFNRFIYRESCWIGGPIAIWFVPAVSFLVDLRFWEKALPLSGYLVRSGAEVLIGIPLWASVWGLFCFWILGWGWI